MFHVNETRNRIVDNVKKHKELYFGVVVGVVLAGTTCLLMRENSSDLPSSSDVSDLPSSSEGSNMITIRPLSFFSKVPVNTTVTTTHTGHKGHPGFMTQCLETGEIFASQAKAAEAFGLDSANLSQHLNGKYDDFGGYHFRRIGVI